MIFLRYVLFPVVPIYYVVTWLRNILYDRGIFKSKSYSIPVICVGNLSVGGTGKTPMIEYLIRLLKADYQVASLSRGYKRKTLGFYLADHKATAESIGDEPYQFYNKFIDEIQVAVDADRQRGIEALMQSQKPPEVILLDDAFQHRKVNAGLNILLSTYDDLYSNDFVLPTGNLREPISGAKRADIIVITKCPEAINTEEKEAVLNAIKPLAHQSVFFSSIVYSDQIFSETQSLKLKTINDFTLVTGIANANPLLKYLDTNGLNYEHLHFKDHHDFSDEDITLISKKALVVTTEKDYVRLLKYEQLKNKVYYLPISITIDRSDVFDMLIRNFC